HCWSAWSVPDPVLRSGQHALELILDKDFNIASDFLVKEGLADAVNDFLGRRGPDVGKVQALLQLLQEFLVNTPLEAKQLCHPGEDTAGFRQPLLDFVEDGTKNHGVSFPLVFLTTK